jgi:hypothetical protein
MKVGYELEYVYEAKSWKLSGIHVSVRRAE